MSSKCLKYPFIDGCKDFPKDKENDVREIRKWLETQPQIPKFNEEFLQLFLHSNYYNLEETKRNIQAYVSLRTASSELFAGRSLSCPKIRRELDNHFFAMAPKRTPEGYQVVYIALNAEKLHDYDHVDALRTMFIFLDIMISESGLCSGYIMVYDTKEFTFPIFLKQNYSALMKLSRYFQEAAPVRVKNIICINSVPFVDKLAAFCRPFLKSTLISKLLFYGVGSNLTNFYKIVPRECVFEEYGGTAGSIATAYEKYRTLLETKYSKWIEEESMYRAEGPHNEVKPAKRSTFWFW